MSKDKKIELVCTNGRLQILSNEQGWSSILLIYEDRSIALGSETIKYITTHLVTFLTDKKIESLKWVLSLSEQHFSFYGEHDKDTASLQIQDSNAKWIADLHLNNEQQTAWLSVLNN